MNLYYYNYFYNVEDKISTDDFPKEKYFYINSILKESIKHDEGIELDLLHDGLKYNISTYDVDGGFMCVISYESVLSEEECNIPICIVVGSKYDTAPILMLNNFCEDFFKDTFIDGDFIDDVKMPYIVSYLCPGCSVYANEKKSKDSLAWVDDIVKNIGLVLMKGKEVVKNV